MTINAVKGVEIGAGMAAAALTGSENADEIFMGNDGPALLLEPRRRHPRRHLLRPGRRRPLRRQADLLDPHPPPHHHRHRRGDRDRHQGPPRPLRRHPRRPRRRGDARLRHPRPLPPPPRPGRRRRRPHRLTGRPPRRRNASPRPAMIADLLPGARPMSRPRASPPPRRPRPGARRLAQSASDDAEPRQAARQPGREPGQRALPVQLQQRLRRGRRRGPELHQLPAGHPLLAQRELERHLAHHPAARLERRRRPRRGPPVRPRRHHPELLLLAEGADRRGLIWGVGPAFLIPTATDRIATNQWGAGVTGVALRQSGPWTVGALANHLWSVTGDSADGDISQTFLQPFLNYTTPKATSFIAQHRVDLRLGERAVVGADQRPGRARWSRSAASACSSASAPATGPTRPSSARTAGAPAPW